MNRPTSEVMQLGMLAEVVELCHWLTGPREPKSTVLSVEDEAIVVTFRRHTQPPPCRRPPILRVV